MSGPLRRVCVFAGSNPGGRTEYGRAARALGHELVQRGVGLVYGGGQVGLMGAVADAVLEGGGEVVGVIPEALLEREIAHQGLRDLRVVQSMHERKAQMADLADGFIALPGGLGTLEEFFEALTWAQLGMHEKPCGLLNPADYYGALIHLLDRSVTDGFLPRAHRAMLIVESEPGPLLDRFEQYAPPRTRKWIEPTER